MLLVAAVGPAAFGMPEIGDYEGRTIAALEVVFEKSPPDPAAQSELVSILHLTVGGPYGAVRVRESLLALFESKLVAAARVEVSPAGQGNAAGPIHVRFVVIRQLHISATRIEITGPPNPAISVNEMKTRFSLLEPGAKASEHALKKNADLIQSYLRDRGFFRAEVEYKQLPDPADLTGSRVIVIFRVTPNEQARVSSFTINITGFDPAQVRPQLKLQPGAPFTQSALGEDVTRIRQAIISLGYLAPQLDEPRTTLDPASNTISISIAGSIGPKVNVTIHNYDLKEKVQRELLPVLREGSIDQSAIVEGERRLRNRLQEEGYFFAEVSPVCSVEPPLNATDGPPAGTCEGLNPDELAGHTVHINYEVDRGRQFKLTDIRIEGTNQLTYTDVADQLRTQKANALGFLPYIGGYGRGYTSKDLLEQDRRTILSKMQDLGYRSAIVTERQGVSVNGDNLIITFVVEEGPLTRVASVEVRGNALYTTTRLRDAIVAAGRERCKNRPEGDFSPCYTTVVGAPFSRSQARSDSEAIRNFYARNGYLEAQVDFATVDLPNKGSDQQVKILYTIRSEGQKIIINDIVVNGLVRTNSDSILKAITLRKGQILRADKITESERILYATDAFRQVIIRTEPAGEAASGYKQSNVIIDVEELKPRILNYGGGYSTDAGPLGFVDVRNVNLFGDLKQGAFRLRASRVQQLARVEYLDPRFKPYGNSEFSPLTISLQYQRDSTVTRFFRTTIDRGNQGIIQRVDEKGNPIDEFGNRVAEPTVNRFTATVESQRAFDPKRQNLLFIRYAYEDVRLFNLESLLLKNILEPDRAVRLSRLGASFVRDTRDSQFDPKRGEYFTFDYSLALRQLGGNLSFNKALLNYRRYYRVEQLRRTVLAGNVTIGAANIFNPRDRDGIPGITEADLQLPISERFFAGGSNTLRGFAFEEAGPRQVIPDCTGQNFTNCFAQFGLFRNSKHELVRLDPFTVPVGGNALAVVNLEARMPVGRMFQLTPFYDGGNVFHTVKELFGRKDPNENPNLQSRWTNTLGLGFGVKTPFGGTISIDYGYLLNPPVFILPQANGDTAFYRLPHRQIHFRFTTAF